MELLFKTSSSSLLGSLTQLTFSYKLPNVWYVAPNTDFYADDATSGFDTNPYFTLSAALTKASDNDVIILYPGRYDTSADIGLTISKPVTIVGLSGAEYTLLDGDQSLQIFEVKTVGTVRFVGLTFQNGYDYVAGGALQVTLGDVSVEDCVFDNNVAGYAPAIAVADPATLLVSGSTFSQNAGFGAIVLDSCSVKISNSVFEKNSGSSIRVLQSYASTPYLAMDDIKFISNSAASGAGILTESSCQVQINNISFINNTANTGSAFFNPGASVTISNLFASGNSGTSGSVLILESGTTVLLTSAEFYENNGTCIVGSETDFMMTGVDFRRNTEAIGRSDKAADVLMYSSLCAFEKLSVSDGTFTSAILLYESEMSLKRSYFSELNAELGSAIYATTNSKLIIEDVTFANNVAHYGILNLDECNDREVNILIENCTFMNNTAELNANSRGGEGGCIFADTVTLNVVNSKFINNTATSGGVMYLSSDVDTSFYNSTGNKFYNNKAVSGGCFYIDTFSTVRSEDELYVSNSASQGGSWALSTAELVATNHRYYKGSSDNHGGGLLASSASSMVMTNVSFESCSAGTGGAISVRSESELTVNDMLVHKCFAEYGGGLAVQEESNVYLESKIKFTENFASSDGGAIYLVRVDQAIPFISEGEFISNTAGSIGGAVYAALCQVLAISNMTTSGNSAVAGSEICALSSNIYLNDTYLYGSQSSTGALYLLHSEFVMYGTTIDTHDASTNGGGLYAFSSDLHIIESTMRNCSAKQGGAIFLFETNLFIFGSEFSNNIASIEGGAIYITGTETVYLQGSTLSNNYAGQTGGAMYIQETTDVDILNSTISQNEAVNQAAGIALEEVTLITIANCYILGNQVTHSTYSAIYLGGALKINTVYGSLLISNNKFIGNGGEVDGGAIYLAYSVSTVIDGNLFSENYAINGGGIYLGPEYGDSSSTNSTIIDENSETDTDRRLLEPPHLAQSKLKICQGDDQLHSGKSNSWRCYKTPPRKVVQASKLSDDLKEIDRNTQRLASTPSSITLSNSVFSQNEATYGGGAFYFEENEPEGTSSLGFQSNTAMYGAEFTAPASYITVEHSGEDEASGTIMSRITVKLMDAYGQLVANENGTTIYASMADVDNDVASVSGETSVDFVNGIGYFDNLVVGKLPDTVAHLEFSAESVVSGIASLNITFRDCIPGEILADGSDTCVTCAYGYYSWDAGEEECHECPENAVCYGGDQMKAVHGYWRFNNTVGRCNDGEWDECSLIECNFGDACLGDVDLSSSMKIDDDFNLEPPPSEGTGVYNKMFTYCYDPDIGEFSGCELVMEGGYFLNVEDGPDTVTTSKITLTDSSKALLFDFDSSLEWQVYLIQDEKCDTGYIGNACDRCDVGYSQNSSTNECTKCRESQILTILVLCFGLIGIICAACIMIKLQMNKENQENEKLSIMMKIFTSYMQLVSLFGSMELSWPDVILELFETQEQISQAGDKILAIDCVLNTPERMSQNVAPIFFQKFAFYMSLPVMSIAFSITIWGIVYLKKKYDFYRKPWDYEAAGLHSVIEDGLIDHDEVRETLEALGENSEPIRVDGVIKTLNMHNNPARVDDFQDSYLHSFMIVCRDNAILSAIVLLFMLHPNVTKYTFWIFTCEELRTGYSYLSEDLETECYTALHIKWMIFGGVCMAIYTFGIPLFGYFVLRSVRHELSDKHVKLKFGFLYDGYEEDYFWWEMWVMIRKVMVVFVIVFIADVGDLTVIAAALVITFCATCLHLRFQPYEDDDLDVLESFALYSTVITLICGIFFYSGETESDSIKVILILIIFLANASFVCYFLFAGYAQFKNKLIEDAKAAKEKAEMIYKLSQKVKKAEKLSKEDKKNIKKQKRKLDMLEEAVNDHIQFVDKKTMLKGTIWGLLHEAREAMHTLSEMEHDHEHHVRELDEMHQELQSSSIHPHNEERMMEISKAINPATKHLQERRTESSSVIFTGNGSDSVRGEETPHGGLTLFDEDSEGKTDSSGHTPVFVEGDSGRDSNADLAEAIQATEQKMSATDAIFELYKVAKHNAALEQMSPRNTPIPMLSPRLFQKTPRSSLVPNQDIVPSTGTNLHEEESKQGQSNDAEQVGSKSSKGVLF